jgi:hypothetical protein
MSARIGEVPGLENPRVHVAASRGGVELLSDERISLEPIEARNYAALLIRAAEEVERMRTSGESKTRHLLFRYNDSMDMLNALEAITATLSEFGLDAKMGDGGDDFEEMTIRSKP